MSPQLGEQQETLGRFYDIHGTLPQCCMTMADKFGIKYTGDDCAGKTAKQSLKRSLGWNAQRNQMECQPDA